MLKITTINLNGIRSATQKGFWEWVVQNSPDILCLQEIRAQEDNLPEESYLKGYYIFHNYAQKPGYSGVSCYSKKKPNHVVTKLGFTDDEGRFIQLEFKNFNIISVYFPSGTSGNIRQQIKYKFMDYFYQYLQNIQSYKKPYIICGDWNIAHKPIDLKNWKQNQNTSGFLPEERAWLDKVFRDLNYVDAFRIVDKEPNKYTWWSHRGKAWEKDIGWRIDYHIISSQLKNKVLKASIYKDQRFSDHAPLTIEYNLNFE